MQNGVLHRNTLALLCVHHFLGHNRVRTGTRGQDQQGFFIATGLGIQAGRIPTWPPGSTYEKSSWTDIYIYIYIYIYRERERVTTLKRPDCLVGISGPGTA